ncbi:hypothetical protein ACUSIJ_12095 [Pseudochelatococcus sp. B33]
MKPSFLHLSPRRRRGRRFAGIIAQNARSVITGRPCTAALKHACALRHRWGGGAFPGLRYFCRDRVLSMPGCRQIDASATGSWH